MNSHNGGGGLSSQRNNSFNYENTSDKHNNLHKADYKDNETQKMRS